MVGGYKDKRAPPEYQLAAPRGPRRGSMPDCGRSTAAVRAESQGVTLKLSTSMLALLMPRWLLLADMSQTGLLPSCGFLAPPLAFGTQREPVR